MFSKFIESIPESLRRLQSRFNLDLEKPVKYKIFRKVVLGLSPIYFHQWENQQTGETLRGPSFLIIPPYDVILSQPLHRNISIQELLCIFDKFKGQLIQNY